MKRSKRLAAIAAMMLLVHPGAVQGSAGEVEQRLATSGSMARQNAVARAEGYTFMRTAADVRAEVERGRLVRVESGGDLMLAGVSFPVARPEVALFLARLGAEHRAACNAPLVVTSLTRPLVRQPRNSSHLSVHPAGMAIDLRIPADRGCRRWLEARLLAMQAAGVLEVIREARPPHYHVGLFPTPYRQYSEREFARSAVRRAESEAKEQLDHVRTVISQLGLGSEAGDSRGRSGWAVLLLAIPLGALVWVPTAVRTITVKRSGLEWWLEVGRTVMRTPGWRSHLRR